MRLEMENKVHFLESKKLGDNQQSKAAPWRGIQVSFAPTLHDHTDLWSFLISFWTSVVLPYWEMLTLITDKTLTTGQWLSLLHQHVHPGAAFPWWYLIWHFSCLSLFPHLFTHISASVFSSTRTVTCFIWSSLGVFLWASHQKVDSTTTHLPLQKKNKTTKVKIQHELLLSLSFSKFVS